MSETFAELDAELVNATKNMTSANSEYESRFISTTPLGSGDISLIPLADIEEATNKIQAARERYSKALHQMNEFRRNHH